jgi:hypothetical protein
MTLDVQLSHMARLLLTAAVLVAITLASTNDFLELDIVLPEIEQDTSVLTSFGPPEPKFYDANVVAVGEPTDSILASIAINTAMSVSGGGSRAFSCATGAFRAMTNAGLMTKMDALGSVSGGSWASSVYMFAPETVDDAT